MTGVKLPIGIVVLVELELFIVLPAIECGSCKGCAFECKPRCDLLCGHQDIIFVTTDEPLEESFDDE